PAQLWVFDTKTTANYDYVLPGTVVWRQTRYHGGSIISAPIDYSGLTEVHVSGGTGQEGFKVQGTAGGATTYVTTNSRASDPLGSQVVVTATKGDLAVSGASGLGRVFVGGGTLAGIQGNILVNAT